MKYKHNLNWKSKKVKSICKICNKEKQIFPYQIKKEKGKFCSRKCQGIWNSKNRIGENSSHWKGGKIKRICQICNKEFYVFPFVIKKGKGKFCSTKCKNIFTSKNIRGKNHPAWRGGSGIYLKKRIKGKNRRKVYCSICKKIIFNKSRLKGTIFCSMKCSKQHTILRNTRHCLNCGKIIIRRGHRSQKFCSRQCSGIWTAKNLIKFKDTSIELMIEQELKKRNISYQKQVPILTTAIVDFLLPNKIIIQCDGNFWHSRKINKGKDIAQDTVLQFNGYKVYRFTETEIKKSAKRCLEKVHFTDDNKK